MYWHLILLKSFQKLYGLDIEIVFCFLLFVTFFFLDCIKLKTSYTSNVLAPARPPTNEPKLQKKIKDTRYKHYGSAIKIH